MKWAIGMLVFFCGALASGIYVGNHQNTPAPVVKEPVKVEQTYTGGNGPCKTCITVNKPDLFGHTTSTVVCPKEYTVTTTTLY